MSQISNEQKLIDGLNEHYSESLASIQEISYNVSNDRYFLDINFKALHVDNIPALTADKLEVTHSCSTDTILFDESNSTLYLIEFKEQWPSDKKSRVNIRLKCYDTLSKLCLFWVNILGYKREDFFNLRFKYCLITRGGKGHLTSNSSFLDALDYTNQCFKLKLLEKTFVDEAKILITPKHIHKLLSRVTQQKQMIYHNTDKTQIHF
ncbi:MULTISPECIES: hypothetical protein [Psychrobacter]|uniref:hypothetical protein n=1 Tax=Psychrobacter TaxID=497 RepID=UPI0007F51CA0|nr:MULTISPECIES: hypothetical protein [Psychrobacter]OAP72425.1 hypothetical protein A7325_10745 [Psychrobacter sp. SHUES1]